MLEMVQRTEGQLRYWTEVAQRELNDTRVFFVRADPGADPDSELVPNFYHLIRDNEAPTPPTVIPVEQDGQFAEIGQWFIDRMRASDLQNPQRHACPQGAEAPGRARQAERESSATPRSAGAPSRCLQGPLRDLDLDEPRHPLDPERRRKVTYIKVPTDLSATNQTPAIPTRYHYLLVDGAVLEAYKDTDNLDAAGALEQSFQAGIRDMQTTYSYNHHGPEYQVSAVQDY
jgi:hypothetical protein